MEKSARFFFKKWDQGEDLFRRWKKRLLKLCFKIMDTFDNDIYKKLKLCIFL